MERVEPTIKITLSKESLQNQVEQLVIKDEMSYSEAICEICNQRMIDPADIAKLVSRSLKSKLEAEAMNRNIIKNTTGKLF